MTLLVFWRALFLVAAIAALALSVASEGGTYYVAPGGRETNDGSRERPWPSVAHALAQVGGGNTIILKPGMYRGPIVIEKQHAGTKEAPTVIKSEVKWKATIMGGDPHCLYTDAGCNWAVIDGFEVFGARFDGIKLLGDHTVVRNCWVHNNVSMGIASHGRKHNTFERNLVEYNGSHVQFHHGMYLSGEGHRIIANIVRHNAGWGLHLYQEIRDSVIANNLIQGHMHRPAIILRCPEDGGRNRVVNNTIVDSPHAIDVVRGNGELIANNILVSRYDPVVYHEGTDNVTIDHNLCAPASEHQGPNGISADPLFVDPTKGLYWLKPDSPAIAKGSVDHAPEADFWGRAVNSDRPPDIGCFPFVARLAAVDARKTWYYQWPYQFYPNKEMGLPDLWALPEGEG